MRPRINIFFQFIALCFLSSTAFGQDFDKLGVFGDNVADPGNIPEILSAANGAGFGPFNADFPPSPPYFGNRFSNGPIAAEYFADQIGISNDRVTNLAVGNAFSAPLPVSLAGGALIGNGSSIPGPIGAGLFPLNDRDISSQVDDFIASAGSLGADDLALLYASANDGALALNTIALTGLDPASALQVIQAGAATNALNTAASAQKLINAGVGTVVIGNLPDIGLTPAAQAGGLSGIQASTGFSQATNAGLEAQAAILNSKNSAVVYVVDNFTLLGDIVANPAKYGLTNVTDPCISTQSCVMGGSEVQDTFLFWDQFFASTAVQEISGAAIADTINAPRTLAAQAETARFSAERFGRSLLQAAAIGESGMFAGVDVQDWDRDGELFSSGYDVVNTSVRIGGQHEICDSLFIGGAVALDTGSVDHDAGLGDFDYQSVRLGFLAGARPEGIDLNFGASFSFDDFDDIDRNTRVANQIASGESDGSAITLMLEAARSFELESFQVRPSGVIGFANSDIDGYSESGAPALNQIVSDHDSEVLFGELGVQLASEFDLGETTLRPYFQASYHAVLSNGDQSVRSALVSVPTAERKFEVEAPDDDSVRLKGGFDFSVFEDGTLNIGGEGLFGGGQIDGYAITIDLSVPLG